MPKRHMPKIHVSLTYFYTLFLRILNSHQVYLCVCVCVCVQSPNGYSSVAISIHFHFGFPLFLSLVSLLYISIFLLSTFFDYFLNFISPIYFGEISKSIPGVLLALSVQELNGIVSKGRIFASGLCDVLPPSVRPSQIVLLFDIPLGYTVCNPKLQLPPKVWLNKSSRNPIVSSTNWVCHQCFVFWIFVSTCCIHIIVIPNYVIWSNIH